MFFLMSETLLSSTHIFMVRDSTIEQPFFMAKALQISTEHYKLYNIKFFISCYLI